MQALIKTQLNKLYEQRKLKKIATIWRKFLYVITSSIVFKLIKFASFELYECVSVVYRKRKHLQFQVSVSTFPFNKSTQLPHTI
jgi:hypothetical protein